MVPSAGKYEHCANLLQYAVVSDAARFAHFVGADGSVRTFDTRSLSADASFRKIQANGVGDHCRWMLTDEALVVRFVDGSYAAKNRPADLRYEGGDNYRIVFSFCADGADLIVVSADRKTYVLRVSAGRIEEESLDVQARLFCGRATSPSDYLLFGQTQRPAPSGYGSPLVVAARGGDFTARVIPPPGQAKLEGVVAWVSVANRSVLICSEAPADARIEDFDRNRVPGASDHDRFFLIPEDRRLGAQARQLNAVLFIGTAGPNDGKIAYFQKRGVDGRSKWASMACLGQDGALVDVNVEGLDARSTIRRIQYDPLVGWLGIADAHTEQRDRHLLSSRDGLAWAVSKLS
jgi:hypothetical protein